MSPALREAVLTAAQACADAEIGGIAAMLQRVADDPMTGDRYASEALYVAQIACDAVASERAMRGFDSRSACVAYATCRSAREMRRAA